MSGTRKIIAVEEAPGEPPSEQDGEPGEKEKMVIRVRRGALRRFDQLTAKSTDLPVEITWDRRLADRRAPAGPLQGERRRGERRQKPPYTWDVADFLVVGDSSRSEPDQHTPPTPRKKRQR